MATNTLARRFLLAYRPCVTNVGWGMEITDSEIRKLKVKAEATASDERRTLEVSDDACKGLRVRASYGGSVGFYLIYRPRGERKVKRLLLGKYPAIGIAEARRRARAKMGEVADGRDPIIEKEQAEAAAAQAAAEASAEATRLASRPTVRAVADWFLHEKRNLRWVHKYRSMLEFNLLSPKLDELKLGLGDKAADDLTAADIDAVLSAMQKRGSEIQARRLYECIRAMIKFAVKKGRMTTNPLGAVSVPANAKPRDRFLSVAELRKVWKALCKWDEAWIANFDPPPPIPHNAVRALLLQLLLGCRIGEITGMQKHEISDDGMSWTIPAERVKNARPHTLPLPPRAREIITAACAASDHKQYVFRVHGRGGPDYQALRADVVAGHVETINTTFKFKKRSGELDPFHTHDLRRTVATYLRKLGIASEVVSAILNHVSEQKATVLGRHYDKDDLEFPMREALTRWDATLDEIAAGVDPFAKSKEDIAELERRVINRSRGPRLVAVDGGRA